MTILYFTATGNSLAVAKHIGGDLISIPQAVKNNQYEFEDDVVGIVFPICSLNFPKMVKKFLKRAVFKADYKFLVVTSDGGGIGKTFCEAQEIAEHNGYSFDYFGNIKMMDNCLPQWEMETERKKLNRNEAMHAGSIRRRL